MTSLTNLNISENFTIKNDDIAKLNLKKLILRNNKVITKIKHMNLLKYLDISGKCVIGDEEIANLNLIMLNAHKNKKITKIKHMNLLTHLDISFIDVNDDEISNLNLILLSSYDNDKITNIIHMTLLNYLNIGGKCGIDVNEINNLYNSNLLISSSSKCYLLWSNKKYLYL